MLKSCVKFLTICGRKMLANLYKNEELNISEVVTSYMY
jgi:hypothetical protein